MNTTNAAAKTTTCPYACESFADTDSKCHVCAPAKVRVTEIKIRRAEGRQELCDGWRTFDSFSAANAWLRDNSGSNPKDGYDKHDAVVTYADGETYEARLDCKHWSCPDNDLNLGAHMVEHLTFMAGLRRPARLTAVKYVELLVFYGEASKTECRAFLAGYEVVS